MIRDDPLSSRPIETEAMRLGLFMMPLHPPTRTLGDYLRETTEKSLLAERLGFDELWVGEHFTATSEPIPSPLMFMASLIRETQRITFGTGVINLPNRHPAVVAAEVAQFDHMSNGRFIFGIGTGSLPSDYELFDVPELDQRNRMMMESLDAIAHIWSQDPPYEFNGEFWSFRIKKAVNERLGIGFMPKPLRPGGPPICVAVSSPNSVTAAIAARRGWGPISTALAPAATVATHWRMYRDNGGGLGRAGAHQPDGTDWRVVKYVLVAGSDAEARARVFSPHSAYRYAFGYLLEVLTRAGRIAGLKSQPDTPDRDVTVDSIIEGRVIYGSPQTVAEKLMAFRRQVGSFGRLLVTGMDWSGPNESWERESMHRLVEEVMPALRQRTQAQAAE
jgi:alkanesulfonate monooxygenase SsuD/methylene tetrahydromethanopterin reductase-like flavin-dependent oxidoreductase (luciferase family)